MSENATITRHPKFEKKLLYVDHEYIEAQLDRNEKAIPSFYEILAKCDTLFGKLNEELTDEDQIRILIRKDVGFVSLIEEKCSPGGVLPWKFLELRGLEREYSDLSNLFKTQPPFNLEVYDLTAGEIAIREEYKKMLTETFTYWTQTEPQNQALEVLKVFAESWNYVFRNNLVILDKGPRLSHDYRDEYWYIRPLHNVLTVERDVNDRYVVKPNYKYIRGL